MCTQAAAGSLPTRSTIVRLAERIAVVGVALAFLLTAYAKMGSRADDMVAQGNLAAILPLVHAYGIDNGGYAGLSVEALRRDYSPGLDDATYVVKGGESGFCVESTYEHQTWRVSAVEQTPTLGDCAALGLV